MMSRSKPLTMLYAAGALASVLGFLWTLSVVGLPWQGVDDGASSLQASGEQATFKPTGNLGNDVQRALILVGELDGEPGSSRAQDIKQAISRAESNRGLPSDGFPDKSLLRQLQTEIEERGLARETGIDKGSRDGASFPGWTIERWESIVQFISVLSGLLMGWLTFFRSNNKQA